MSLPETLRDTFNAALQTFGLGKSGLTNYDAAFLQKALVGVDGIGRTNSIYQVTGNTLQYVDPDHQKLRERLVGQVGQVNAFFAKKAAALQWTAWRRGKAGKREELPFDTPMLDLLWRPNPMTSYGVFMRQISTLYHADGNVYIWANRLESGARKGQAQELWILPSSLVEPRGGGPMQSVTAYRYTPDKSKPGEYEDLDVADVLHLKNDPLPHEVKGVSTIQSAFREATTDKSTSDAANSQMQNAGPPGLIAVEPIGDNAPDLSLPTIQDIRSRFDRGYTGPQNRGKIPIVSAKVRYVSTGVSIVDLQLLEVRKVNLRELCGWWGFSAVLLGDMEASTDNNYQNARKAMYTDGILPYLESITAEFSRWLPPMFGIPDAWFEVNTSSIQELQEDKAALVAWLKDAYWVKTTDKQRMTGVDEDPTLAPYYIPAGLQPSNVVPEEPLG
jgi:HK97 family phage portal protein